MIIFKPYGASMGCLALRKELKGRGLNAKRTKKSGSRYTGRGSDLIINWGCHNSGIIDPRYRVLNPPSAVIAASNKLRTFRILEEYDVPTPRWTTEREIALDFRFPIYCRTTVRGSQGRGIVLAHSPAEMVEAEVYTESIPYHQEFRVHVFNGKILTVIEKRRMSRERLDDEGISEADMYVRNHKNGWVFCRGDVTPSDSMLSACQEAVSALDLDFGAVDVVVDSEGNPYILEINTAPGLEGTTIKEYADEIESVYSDRTTLR